MSLHGINVLFACILVLITCNASSIGGIYFKFKGLIGLPQFLKVHVMIGFDDPKTKQSYILDFIPIDAANPEVMAKIVSGKSMPGEIRIKKTKNTFLINNNMRTDEISGNSDIIPLITSSENEENIGEDNGEDSEEGDRYANLLISDFDPTLNLYFNNCYNFAFHCFMKDKSIREMLT